MSKSRRIKWSIHVERTWEKMVAYKILEGKPEGKRPLGRSRRRWVENIKIGWYGLALSGSG
jgi:hypothetical protein